jgi:hypothetical protein
MWWLSVWVLGALPPSPRPYSEIRLLVGGGWNVICSVGPLRRTPNLGRRQEAWPRFARSLRDLLPPSENQGSVGDCPTEEIT